jgi:hypothetical protein
MTIPHFGDSDSSDSDHLRSSNVLPLFGYELFLDETCPLPKYSRKPLQTMSGKPFPDFYFCGSSLIRAFVLLGEAERDAKKK